MAKTFGRDLTTAGKLAYNGVIFPVPMKTQATARCNYSRDGRTVKDVTHTITTEGIVVPEDYSGSASDTNGFLDSLREDLTKSCRELVFFDRGYGDLVVNKGKANTPVDATGATTTTALDVNFGPRPQVLTWRPIAAENAAEIRWQVETTIPECPNARYKDSVQDHFFSISWGIDQNRMTTRTITGVLEIPLTRKSHNSPKMAANDTADFYRKEVAVPSLAGWQRIIENYELSPDRKSINYTVVDREIPSDNPFYPGMINMEATHTVSNTNILLNEWAVSVSGRVEIAPGFPQTWKWFAMRHVLSEKIKHAKSGTRTAGDGTKISRIIPRELGFEISNDVFGRSASFNVSYVLLSDLQTLFKATGIWKSLDGVTWDKWSTSLQNVLGVRGWANQKHQGNEDVILDLCTSVTPGSLTESVVYTPKTTADEVVKTQPCPPPDQSWLVYCNKFAYHEKTNFSIAAILHDTSSKSQAAFDGMKETLQVDQRNNRNGHDPKKFSKITPKAVMSHRGSDYHFLVMRGYAIRFGYEIPSPSLQKIGGQDPRKTFDYYEPQLLGVDSNGCPAYSASWMKVYLLEEAPATPQGMIDNLRKQAADSAGTGTSLAAGCPSNF